jgi:two-component system NtrC family sensor kinase
MTKILLVEDDIWLADLEADVLVDAGYTVQIALNAPAAIDFVDSFHPEVIVLDVLLAGSTAFALLNELQSYSDTGMVPVILCTNIADQFDPSKLKEYGVKRVVDKTTMHIDDIVVAVRSVV